MRSALAIYWPRDFDGVRGNRPDVQPVIQQLATVGAYHPRVDSQRPIFLHCHAEQSPSIIRDDFDRSARHFVFRFVAVKGGVTVAYFHNFKSLTSEWIRPGEALQFRCYGFTVAPGVIALAFSKENPKTTSTNTNAKITFTNRG